MKTIAIVQARTGSTRLPSKVMRPVCGTPLIGLLLSRLQRARRLDGILVATTDVPSDDGLAAYVRSAGVEVFRGSENDVLDRYCQATRMTGADAIVRITADCPLIDPEVVDLVVNRFESAQADYASNTAPPTFPDGLDVEVFSASTLEAAWRDADRNEQREHVTLFMRESGRFATVNVASAEDWSGERWTVDRPEDLEVVCRVFEHFHPRRDFGWLEVLALRRAHPDWFEANRHIIRNEALQQANKTSHA